MSSHSVSRKPWLKRNAAVVDRWSTPLLNLGAYGVGFHRLQQHAYFYAAFWFCLGVGGTWMFVDDVRQARREAKRARQRQLQKLAELLREMPARGTDPGRSGREESAS